MKIKSLAIRNFRSIANINLDSLGNYLSISGRNNAGKTNVVSAMFAAVSGIEEEEDFEIFIAPAIIRRGSANFSKNLPVWMKGEDTQDNCSIYLRLTMEVSPDVDMGITRFLETMRGEGQPTLQGPVELVIEVTAKSPDYKQTVAVSVGDSQLDDYRSGEVLRKIRSMNPFYYHNSVEMNHRFVVGQSFRELVGDSIQSKINDLSADWTALTSKLSPVLEDARSELGGLLGRLEDRFSVSLSIHDQLSPAMLPLSVSLEDNTRPVPMAQWGSGTRNRSLILARILNAIRRSKDNDDIQPIIVIEEPESFLHPSAQADFGRVLQAISRDVGVQIIVTTHSPYLLSHQTPEANILLERRRIGEVSQTCVAESQTDWIRPFELALGISSPELYGLKGVFFGEEDRVIFCEGTTDAAYLEFFRDPRHGDRALTFSGAIYPYGGASKIQNQTLLKFIRERFGTIVITVDLDVVGEVRNDVTKAGFVLDKDFIPIGVDMPGKKSIEGLVPHSIIAAVFSENPDIALAMQERGDKDAAKSARSTWKQLVLKKFLDSAVPGSAELGPFYDLIRKLNSSIGTVPPPCDGAMTS